MNNTINKIIKYCVCSITAPLLNIVLWTIKNDIDTLEKDNNNLLIIKAYNNAENTIISAEEFINSIKPKINIK